MALGNGKKIACLPFRHLVAREHAESVGGCAPRHLPKAAREASVP